MPDDNSPQPRRWYQALGPGLITACVVIGPGSILTSSKVGAGQGYGMSWVVLLSVIFMVTYLTLGARLGVVAKESTGKLVADRAGRWLAALIGISVFFISAAFQFGNNLGVDTAFNTYIEFDYIIVVFNALAIAFLLFFKNLYKALERLMVVFVGVMLLAFAANLFFAKPDLGQWARGFVPGAQAEVSLSVLGLVGTTFVITAAYFQTFLVRQKGWDREQLREGMVDARVGAVLMMVITLMIMGTSAAVLKGETLGGVGDVAAQLEPLFGKWGKGLFCLGLFSAAYSSFIVNSMIGGFILSDGLGLGSNPEDKWPKRLTIAVLLTGMIVALLIKQAGFNKLHAIVAAQAVTVVASPLVAGALLWLSNRKDVMGEDRNGPVANIFGSLGLAVLIAMAGYTAFKSIPDNIEKIRASQTVPAER